MSPAGWFCNWEAARNVWSVKWGMKCLILCWWIWCFTVLRCCRNVLCLTAFRCCRNVLCFTALRCCRNILCFTALRCCRNVLCFTALRYCPDLFSGGTVNNSNNFYPIRRMGLEPVPLWVTNGTKRVLMTFWNWLLDSFIHYEIFDLGTSVLSQTVCYFTLREDRLLGAVMGWGGGGGSGLWWPSTGARSIFTFMRNSVCIWKIRTDGYHRRPVTSVASFVSSLGAVVDGCTAEEPSGCCQHFEDGL